MAAALIAFTYDSAAQSHAIAGFHPVPARGTPSGFTVILGSGPNQENFFHPGAFFAAPLFYPTYGYEPPLEQKASPEVLVIERSAEPAVREEPKPTSPLMIEWRGDRFVRMMASEYDLNPRSVQPDYGEEAKSAGNLWSKKATQVPSLSPTILVFRDGRQEQTSNYVIVAGMLYEYSDYWMGSSSTKQISIAELDIPATLRANREHQVKFILPIGPNEVVTRP